MASRGTSWSLPLIFETITALCFAYVCKFPIAGKGPTETICTGSFVTKVVLVAFALLCPFVHQFLLPVQLLSRTIEEWLKNANAHADATHPHGPLAVDMMYNAMTSCTVAACVFTAYMALLRRYDRCARAMGQAHLRLEKDRENRVSFVEPEPVCTGTHMTPGYSIKRGVAVYGAVLAGSVVLLPNQAQNTFAYLFVERGWLRITSDHVWISATVLFAAVMARRVWFSFNHFPAGYCKGLYAAGQFSIAYGSVLCISVTAFLTFAADVMVTYTYKLMRLHQMRALQPLAQAEEVVLRPDANPLTSSFANYLVDCTLAALAPGLDDDATLAMLRLLAVYYRGVFIDCVEIMLFGCLVFAPMAMVLLVSLYRRA